MPVVTDRIIDTIYTSTSTLPSWDALFTEGGPTGVRLVRHGGIAVAEFTGVAKKDLASGTWYSVCILPAMDDEPFYPGRINTDENATLIAADGRNCVVRVGTDGYLRFNTGGGVKMGERIRGKVTWCPTRW